jgi:hypothetical protein
MKIRSAARGASASAAEVTNVSVHGFWLLLEGEELFVSFADFPWFKDAPIAKLTNVAQPHPGHLHWPDLDIDLSITSIRDPARFPLLADRPR